MAAVSLLVIYPKAMKARVHPKAGAKICIAFLFIIAKIGSKPNVHQEENE